MVKETVKVNRVIQTAKGLDCEPLQPNSNLRMICTNEFNEDSVCTLLCHQTRSGIGKLLSDVLSDFVVGSWDSK